MATVALFYQVRVPQALGHLLIEKSPFHLIFDSMMSPRKAEGGSYENVYVSGGDSL
jgi:hypothetical protein